MIAKFQGRVRRAGAFCVREIVDNAFKTKSAIDSIRFDFIGRIFGLHQESERALIQSFKSKRILDVFVDPGSGATVLRKHAGRFGRVKGGGIFRPEHRFESEKEPKILLRGKRRGRAHQREHAIAHPLLLLLRPDRRRDCVKGESANSFGARCRCKGRRIKSAFFDRRIDFMQQLLLLANHDVLSMQRDGEEGALFIVGLVAVQIQLLRLAREIVVALRLRENKERETFFKARGRNLRLHDLLERGAEFRLQVGRCFESGVDRFVHRPKRLTGDEIVACFVAGPVGKRSVGQK